MNRGLDPKGRVELANLLIQIGLREEAVVELTRVAAILEREGKSEEAVALYERILELDPRNQAALRRLEAVRPSRPRSPSEVLSYLKEHLTELPEDYARRKEVVEALLKAGVLEAARPHLDLLWKEAPDSWVALFWAKYYRATGNLQPAIRYLEAGLSLSPSREESLKLYYELGELYESQGDWARAREAFSSLSRLDPEYLDVADRLARLPPSPAPEPPYPVVEEPSAQPKKEGMPELKLGEENISFL